MKKYSVLFLCSLFAACSFLEKKQTVEHLFFEPQTKKEVIQKEQQLGAVFYEEIDESQGSFKGEEEKFEKVVLFVRNKNAAHPIKTKYYFTENSDSIRLIQYEWTKDLPGFSTAERDKIMEEEGRKIEDYVKKYHEIAVQLGQRYGQPLAQPNGELLKEKFEALDIWKKQLLWETSDEKIDLSLVWIPKKGYQIHKIYCKIYHKK